jgi:hypothetical protein
VLVRRAGGAGQRAIRTSSSCIPHRGLLILEVKDWKPDTLRAMTRADAALLTAAGA